MNNPTPSQMYAALSSLVRPAATPLAKCCTCPTVARIEAMQTLADGQVQCRKCACTCFYLHNEQVETGCPIHDAGAIIRSIMAKRAIVSSVDFV